MKKNVWAPHHVTSPSVLTSPPNSYRTKPEQKCQSEKKLFAFPPTLVTRLYIYQIDFFGKLIFHWEITEYKYLTWYTMLKVLSVATCAIDRKQNPAWQQWLDESPWCMRIYHLRTFENKEIYIHISIRLCFAHRLCAQRIHPFRHVCQTVDTCHVKGRRSFCINRQASRLLEPIHWPDVMLEITTNQVSGLDVIHPSR